MALQKFRWSTTYESAEEELQDQLQRKNIDAVRQSAEPFATIDITTVNSLRIWCAEGSFTLNVADQTISMQPGDTIDVPAGANVDAIAGLNGCGYYQANAPSA